MYTVPHIGIFVFILTSLNLYCIVNGQIYCNNASQCASTTLSTSSGDIECNGYGSCDLSTITTTSGDHDIYCLGSYSCVNSPSITSDDAILCSGLISCVYGTLSAANGKIECDGEKACVNSLMYQKSTSDYLSCLGFESCMLANIYATYGVLHRGLFSGKNSIIYSDDTNGIFEFEGALSGYGATIVCNDGHTCDVRCWGDNCNDLTLTELGSGTFVVTCYYDAKQSSACPNGTQLSSYMYEIPNLLNVSISDSDYNYNEYTCNPENINAIHCSDFEECEYYSSLVNTDKSTICCSGREGCAQISNLVLNGTINSNQTSRSLRCDANGGCSYSTIRVVNYVDIYLSASYACVDCTITATATSDIFCSGEASCYRIEVVDARFVYCVGNVACYVSTFSNIYKNAYFYGYQVGHGVDIINIIGSIYCDGRVSCYILNAINVGGDVYGSGFQSLYSSKIQNVNNSLLAFGYQSLAQSTINSTYNLYLDGTYCFEGSTVTGVHNVKVNGTNSLKSSAITSFLSGSGNTNDNIFRMAIYGSNSDSFTVTCSHNDICYIRCFGSDSCVGMNLLCLGGSDSCFVDCDNNRTGCPSGSSYSEWITDTPTALPTDIPSDFPTYPTISPTYTPTIPTSNPTTIPTGNPTHVPSGHPSINPSKHPSTNPSNNPSSYPTTYPTTFPTKYPIRYPTDVPTTTIPTSYPTTPPTINPSTNPSSYPSSSPSSSPSRHPSSYPTTFPTTFPTAFPTSYPTTTDVNNTNSTDHTNVTVTADNTRNSNSTDTTGGASAHTTITSGESTESGSDQSSSTQFTFSNANIFILTIILATIFLCLVCGCWIVTYCLFKVKSDSKILKNEIQSQLTNNLNHSHQLKADRLAKLRSIELGAVNAHVVRSMSPSMNATDIAYNYSTRGADNEDDDDDDDNHSVSQLFDHDTTNGIDDNGEKGSERGGEEDDKEELVLQMSDIDINYDDDDEENRKNTGNFGENNIDDQMPDDNVNIDANDGNDGNDRNDANVEDSIDMDDVMKQNDDDNKNKVTKGNLNGDDNVAIDDNNNGVGHGIIGSLDETKYKQWSRKQVLIWLKENLLNNGFTKERSKEFLKEFNKMEMTGGSLYTLKNCDKNDRNEKFDKLIQQFSKKNQQFGIWLVVQSCIENININSQNVHVG